MRFLALPLVALAGGCVVVAAATVGAVAYGSIRYVEGEAVQDYRRPARTVHRACVEVARSKGLLKLQERFDFNTGGIVQGVQTVDQEKVTMKTEPVSENTSRLSIRVGFDDRFMAEQYHKHVTEFLEHER